MGKTGLLRRAVATRGRSGRGEFFGWTLAAAVLVGAGLAAELLVPAPTGAIFGVAFLLAATIWLCAAARRLHDVGRTAWWLLAGAAPVIGWLLLLWWFLQPSLPALNRHGKPPPGVFYT